MSTHHSLYLPCLVLLVCAGRWSVKSQDVCTGRADIAFLVDRSSSIKPSNFTLIKEFLMDIANGFEVGSDAVRFAAAGYCNTAKLLWKFDKYNNRNDVQNAINNIQYTGGRTNTSGALWLVDTEIIGQGGDRPDAPNILIVLTDGNADIDIELLPVYAQILKDKDVLLIAVGATFSVDISTLRIIATNDNFVLRIEQFDQMKDHVQQVRDMACQGVEPGQRYIKLWETTSKEGPSVTIRFQPQDSTATSPVDHYVLQYSNMDIDIWNDGITVTPAGDDGGFITVTQDGLEPGIWYRVRVIPVIAPPGEPKEIVKLWEIINGTGPYVTVRFQTLHPGTAKATLLDHYVVQYRKHGNTDWTNGTTVTSTGEEDNFLVMSQNYLEPGTLYMLRVIPVISGQEASSSIIVLIGGAAGGVLFVLVVVLVCTVIYIRRKKGIPTYDDTKPRVSGSKRQSEERTNVSGPEEIHHDNVGRRSPDIINSATYETIRNVVVANRWPPENAYQEIQD